MSGSSSSDRPTPSFLIIGAGKSGTTSVWRYLDQHPEVFMSPVKEPNFFALKGQSLTSGDDPDRMHHYPQSVTTWDDYQELFADAPPDAVTGEASPMYLYDDRAPANIEQHLGTNVRLVAFLRQPAERLFSRWQHLVADGHPPSDDIRDAFDSDSIWWRRPDLVPEGFYGAHLRRYLDRFPRSHLNVFLFSELVEHPQETMTDLYDFLGVDPSFEPVQARYNSSHRLQNSALAWLFGRESGLKEWVASTAPALLQRLRNTPTVQRLLTWLRRRLGHRDALTPALRRRLTHEIYEDDIRTLESLLERRLPHWR